MNEGRDRLRRLQESAYRFMSAMAGNLPGFEEATRALFARDPERFEGFIRRWPKDIRAHLERMVGEFMEDVARPKPKNGMTLRMIQCPIGTTTLSVQFCSLERVPRIPMRGPDIASRNTVSAIVQSGGGFA